MHFQAPCFFSLLAHVQIDYTSSTVYENISMHVCTEMCVHSQNCLCLCLKWFLSVPDYCKYICVCVYVSVCSAAFHARLWTAKL